MYKSWQMCKTPPAPQVVSGDSALSPRTFGLRSTKGSFAGYWSHRWDSEQVKPARNNFVSTYSGGKGFSGPSCYYCMFVNTTQKVRTEPMRTKQMPVGKCTNQSGRNGFRVKEKPAGPCFAPAKHQRGPRCAPKGCFCTLGWAWSLTVPRGRPPSTETFVAMQHRHKAAP